MKRIAGFAAALLAALVVTGGGFSACSGGSSYVEEAAVPLTKAVSVDGLIDAPVTKVESANDKVAEVTDHKETTRAAVTAKDGNHITEFTITGKSKGKTYIIITTEKNGTEDKKYLPVTVSDKLAVETGELTATEPEESGSGEEEESSPATAKTYDFATWATVDLEKFGGDQYTDSSGAKKNTLKSPEGSTKLSTGATIYNKSENAIMIRTTATDNLTPIGLNYNGGQKSDDFSKGVTVDSLDRYVSIPVDGTGKITASVKFISSSGKTGKLQAVLVDSDGNKLGAVVEKDVAEGGETTVEGTTTGATTVILAFSRNGAGGGGLDVTKIEVTPAK